MWKIALNELIRENRAFALSQSDSRIPLLASDAQALQKNVFVQAFNESLCQQSAGGRTPLARTTSEMIIDVRYTRMPMTAYYKHDDKN